MPLWILCEVSGWKLDLFLDLDGFAFQTSISLGIAASQREYYQDDSERRQTPVPGCLLRKFPSSCPAHLGNVTKAYVLLVSKTL